MTKAVIGSKNKVRKRMNIWSLGSGVRLVSEPVGEVWASTSESRLFSAAVGSWTVIVQSWTVPWEREISFLSTSRVWHWHLSLLKIFELLTHNLCNLRSNKGRADPPCLSGVCEGRMRSGWDRAGLWHSFNGVVRRLDLADRNTENNKSY